MINNDPVLVMLRERYKRKAGYVVGWGYDEGIDWENEDCTKYFEDRGDAIRAAIKEEEDNDIGVGIISVMGLKSGNCYYWGGINEDEDYE